MTFLEAFLLAAALCVDSLVMSATTAFREKMPWRRGIQMAFIFALCQGAFPLAGAVIGDVARAFIEAVDHWIAFALLAFVGGRMIVEAVGASRASSSRQRDASAGSVPRSTSHRHPIATYFLLGVATSIDALAVGIGLGLDQPMVTVLWVVLLIGLVTLLVSLLGLFLGKRSVPIPERTATLLAGLVLLALGLKILLDHLLA